MMSTQPSRYESSGAAFDKARSQGEKTGKQLGYLRTLEIIEDVAREHGPSESQLLEKIANRVQEELDLMRK
jgi:hypothetical protein